MIPARRWRDPVSVSRIFQVRLDLGAVTPVSVVLTFVACTHVGQLTRQKQFIHQNQGTSLALDLFLEQWEVKVIK